MKRLMIPLVGLIAVACSNSGTDTSANGTAPATPAATTGATAPAGAAGFAAVQPILTANCLGCHGGRGKKGGWSAKTYADVMATADDGAVVVAGDPDKSLLVQVLKGPVTTPKVPQMPFGKPALSAADIQTISDWVKAGAKES
jgi:mono/diheme cytochrome c family protein